VTAIERGPSAFDVVARERQVVGTGPRIEPVSDAAVPESAWELARRLRAANGGAPPTSLSAHMRTMVKHAEMFRCQLEQATALYAGLLPQRERELAILRVGWLTRAPYEWGEHALMGKRYGLSADEVARVREGSSAPGWTEHEAAVIAGAEELVGDFALSDATWNLLARTYDEAQMIEYLIVVGQYVATAMLQNSLRVSLSDANRGLRQG
jgi:alkylhydroperoxidase family enzyme